MKRVGRISILVAVIAIPALSSCTSAPAHDESGAIAIHLRAGDGSVFVRIENAADHPVDVRNPRGLWVVPGAPGMELRVADANGSERLRCAMVEPSPAALGALTVVPARSFTADDIEIAYVAQIFCLGPGRYRLVAILRDANSDDRASVVARSNWADFLVTGRP